MATAQEISYGGTAGVGGNAGLAQIIPDRESVYLKYPGMILSDKFRKSQLQAEKLKASKPIEEIKLVPLDETLIESKQIQKAKDYYGYLNQAERQGVAHSLNPELQAKRRETELSLNTLKNLNAQVKDLKNGEFKYYDKNRLINEYIPSQLGEYLKDDNNINQGKQFDPKIANATNLFKKQFFLSDFAKTIEGLAQEQIKATGRADQNIFGSFATNTEKGGQTEFRFMRPRKKADGTYETDANGGYIMEPGISDVVLDNLVADPTYRPHAEANANERLDALIRSTNQNPIDSRQNFQGVELKEGDEESRTMMANYITGAKTGKDAYIRRIAEEDLNAFQTGSTKNIDRTQVRADATSYFGFGSEEDFVQTDDRLQWIKDFAQADRGTREGIINGIKGKPIKYLDPETGKAIEGQIANVEVGEKTEKGVGWFGVDDKKDKDFNTIKVTVTRQVKDQNGNIKKVNEEVVLPISGMQGIEAINAIANAYSGKTIDPATFRRLPKYQELEKAGGITQPNKALIDPMNGIIPQSTKEQIKKPNKK